jgi:hypothetical protein
MQPFNSLPTDPLHVLALNARCNLAMANVLAGIDDERARQHLADAEDDAMTVGSGAEHVGAEMSLQFVGHPVLAYGWTAGYGWAREASLFIANPDD